MYNKFLFMPLALCLAAISLTGCVSTQLKSMGTLPMPTAHQPRLNPESKDAEKVVSVDGFALFNNSWTNTDEIYGGGGSVSGIYRFGGGLSPLFTSLTVGGYGGNVNFACDKKKDCGEGYRNWLKHGKNNADQSFWGIQERVMFGAEFNIPANLFLGLGGGAMIYQSGGDYDKIRKKLDKAFRNIDSDNEHVGAYLLVSTWLGYHIGQNGKYGTISLDMSASNAFIDDNMISLPMNLGYFHPSGFHGGVGYANGGADVFVGKSFQF